METQSLEEINRELKETVASLKQRLAREQYFQEQMAHKRVAEQMKDMAKQIARLQDENMRLKSCRSKADIVGLENRIRNLQKTNQSLMERLGEHV